MAKELQKSKSKDLPPIVTNKETVREMMRLMDSQLQHMLPSFIDARKLLAVLLSACMRQPLLFKCSTRSFIGALLECAMIGLYPDGSLGHAWFIPFKDKRGQYHVQLIIGYKGYQTLALNTKQVSRIKAVAVHEGDHFHWQEGTDPKIEHTPTDGVARNDKTLTHVYGYAKLIVTPDDPQFVVLTKAEVNSTMNRSKAGTRGPWGTDYVAMARKTAINRVCNTLQLSPDLSRAATLDDMAASGINQKLGASPLLQDIGQDLQLPEPEFDQDDDDDGQVVDVPMPRAKGRGGQQDGSKGPSSAARSADPALAQADAPVTANQEPPMDDLRPDSEPETPIAEPQDGQDGLDAPEGTSGGGDLFPEAPAEKPSGRKQRAWKPTKRMIDLLQEEAMASGWTRDQLLQYVHDTFEKGLSDLTKDEYDLAADYVTENTP